MPAADHPAAGSESADTSVPVAAEGSGPRIFRRPQRDEKPPVIQALNFGSPVFLSPAKLRRLRLHHDEFARSATANLSVYLRAEFSLQLTKIETLPYQKLIESLPEQSYLTLFKLKPLPGLCVVDVDPKLGSAVVDRLMGGRGIPVAETRDFTGVERAVLGKFVEFLLKEYSECWAPYQKLEPEITGTENSHRNLTGMDGDEVFLFLELNGRLGDTTGAVQFLIPYASTKKMVATLLAEIAWENDAGAGPALSGDPAAAHYSIPIGISAYWRGSTVTLSQLGQLEVGDILILDSKKCEEAVVNLGRVPKFIGRLETDPDRLKIRLISRIT